MAVIVKAMGDINHFFNKYEDPRSKNLPLMSSPFYTIGLSLAYVYIVKVVGPKYMRDRKPYSLRNTLILYNLIQVIFSAWMFFKTALHVPKEYYLKCQPLDKSEMHLNSVLVSACWWYFFSKFTEFFDTIFFVMRKKFNQVSTLHIIHHSVMPFAAWVVAKTAPVGHPTFGGLINIFVHIVMYSYYMLSALGPKVQKYLWWKKYITSLQLFQFLLAILHIGFGLLSDCFHPRGVLVFQMSIAIMFIFLFSNFYKHAYTKKISALNVGTTSDNKNEYETSKNGRTMNGFLCSVRRRRSEA